MNFDKREEDRGILTENIIKWYANIAPEVWSVGAAREKSAAYGVIAFCNGGVVDGK